MDEVRAENAVRELLLALDQDIESEGMKDTPRRVAEMFIAQCTEEDAELECTFQEDNFDGLIMLRDIPVASFCAHHLIPWSGRAHIAYISNKKLLGLSKLSRLTNSCSKGFTIQEVVTRNIADRLYNEIEPKGVMVVIEAIHPCMSLRGVKASGASTTTSAVRGIFRDVIAAREEFLGLINKGGPR